MAAASRASPASTPAAAAASSLEVGLLLRALRDNAGLTQEALARSSGCSKAYLSLVESGQRRLSIRRAAALEAALQVRDGRLQAALNWQRVPEAIRANLRLAQSRTAAMTQHLRDALHSDKPLESLRRLIEQHERDQPADARVNAAPRRPRAADAQSTRPVRPAEFNDELPPRWGGRAIPIINNVAAGSPREFTDLDYPRSIADEYLACPDIADPDAFAARVLGDSMEPEYVEGDVVVFSPEARIPLPDGETSKGASGGADCFVRLERDNETTFKRVYVEDGGRRLRLQPLNSAYPPRIVKREDVAGMYAAVYVLRRVNRTAAAAHRG